MKKAFTMIELIFVIVIIGILSSIAIPKLVATRDDAKISFIATEVADGVSEVAAYALSTGNPSLDLPSMSNVISSMIAQGNATFTNNILYIKMNNISDCLKLTVSTSSLDMHLALSYGNTNGDNMCIALQQTINTSNYFIPLRGQRVAR